MQELEPFIGEWEIRTSLGEAHARAFFEWTLDGAFLAQRNEIEIPEAPNGLMLVGPAREGNGYLQHYFDTRGVARLYEMTFADGLWTLERTKPDFTPLDFSQRYIGRLSDDGNAIDGQWEISHDHETWEVAFQLGYTRVS